MMIKKKFYASIRLALWWFLPILALADATKACCKDNRFYGRAIIGTTMLKAAGQCVLLTAYFSDNSLEDLVWHAPPANAEFTRDGQAVKDFAGQTTIVVYGYLLPCQGRRTTASSQSADRLMKSLKFRTRWARNDSQEFYPVDASATPRIALGEEHWKYRFGVPSEGIPLSTLAEIEISTEYGDKPAFIQGSLYTGLRNDKLGRH